jgi:hypothetical protein
LAESGMDGLETLVPVKISPESRFCALSIRI